MIPALFCIVLPFAGPCTDYVRDVPKIADVVQNRARYTGHVVSVTGRVTRLDQWVSRSGWAQETFSICDDGCIRVYMETHSPIHDGELVTVRGPYYQAFHVGHSTYYNEIEGTEVIARE